LAAFIAIVLTIALALSAGMAVGVIVHRLVMRRYKTLLIAGTAARLAGASAAIGIVVVAGVLGAA